MTTADSVLVFTFLIAAVMTSGASFYLRKPLMWLIAAVMWILCGMSGLRLMEDAWDAMAFLFWMSIGLMIACVLMILETRRMEREEEKKEENKTTDDTDEYMEHAGEYAKKQDKISAATGGRRVKRRR